MRTLLQASYGPVHEHTGETLLPRFGQYPSRNGERAVKSDAAVAGRPDSRHRLPRISGFYLKM